MTDTLPAMILASDETTSPGATARQWAPVFRALGDPVRLEITLLLAERPCSVKELQNALGHNQALVSHHLRTLREQGIVTSRAVGRSNIYEICVGPLACLTRCLGSMVSATDDRCACPA